MGKSMRLECSFNDNVKTVYMVVYLLSSKCEDQTGKTDL